VNGTLEAALRAEGLDGAAIDRLDKVLWDAELTVTFDRARWETRLRVNAQRYREERAESNIDRALKLDPKIDELTMCARNVPRRDSFRKVPCERKATYMLDGRPLCTQHVKTA